MEEGGLDQEPIFIDTIFRNCKKLLKKVIILCFRWIKHIFGDFRSSWNFYCKNIRLVVHFFIFICP